jgi:hypothetical protein
MALTSCTSSAQGQRPLLAASGRPTRPDLPLRCQFPLSDQKRSSPRDGNPDGIPRKIAGKQVDTDRSCLAAAIHRNARNYPGWNLHADASGCRSLWELLNALAADESGTRTITLTPPTSAQLGVPNN